MPAESSALCWDMVSHRQRALFWKYVSIEEGCWPWTGSTVGRGYGRMGIGVKPNRTNVLAHRLSYVLHIGTIPEGAYVLHSCDNPPCCNPEHLSLGTHAENMRQKLERGRQSRPAGERNWRARLTEAAVREMREHDATLRRGQKDQYRRDMAARFGVTPRAIKAAILGENWSNEWLLRDGPEAVSEGLGL